MKWYINSGNIARLVLFLNLWTTLVLSVSVSLWNSIHSNTIALQMLKKISMILVQTLVSQNHNFIPSYANKIVVITPNGSAPANFQPLCVLFFILQSVQGLTGVLVWRQSSSGLG